MTPAVRARAVARSHPEPGDQLVQVMVWVPHPGNPKYEVAVCDTGFVSLVYAREVANLAVILQATMSDATKTPVEDWRSAKTIQCRNAP